VPDVKRPTLREEQAGITRRRIVDAARRRFYRDGYAATTLRVIAADAGVAVQTVYAVFGSKAAILDELRSMAVHQPDADATFAAAVTSPTLDERLSGMARSIRLRWSSVGDIVRVDADAARVDPAVRASMESALAQRRRGITAFVKALAHDLEADLDVARVIAVVDALTLYEVYAQLVVIHGWTPAAYEAWLRTSLIAALSRGREP
jgi:AcrR family transcriptional regulator